MRRREFLGVLVGGAVTAWPGAASAQDYPTRPIKLVVVTAAGGLMDVAARLTAEHVGRSLGQRILVENRPGSGGNLGAEAVAKAEPDGHTIGLIQIGNVAINPYVYTDLTFDPLVDLIPVAPVTTSAILVIANAQVPAQNLRELIALARREPGKLSYGSGGPGTAPHLAGEMFKAAAGIDLLHVPYRGGTNLVTGLLKGEVQAGWSGIPNVMPLIEDGKLRVLCISTQQRSKSVAGVPTAIELGVAGFDYATMMGLQTSAGASRALVARLQAAIAKALREPDIVDRMAVLGMDLRENGTADYVAFMRDDIERYRTAIKTFKLQFN